MALTATRLRILENQQTGIAKKVYAVVPIQEIWSSSQIVSELRRTSSVRDLRMVEGCLNTLKEVGLIREPSPGSFQRMKPRELKEETVSTHYKPAPTAVDVVPKKEPLDRILGISTKLRALSRDAEALAEDIENAAVEFEERVGSSAKELEVLRRFKDLFKKL